MKKVHLLLKDLTVPCGASHSEIVTSFLRKNVTCEQCKKPVKK